MLIRGALDALSKPAVSRTIGRLVRLPLPRPVMWTVGTTFAKVFGADLSESADPTTSFPTFQAFFTRRLKLGARPISQDPRALPSPADGVLSMHGSLARGTLVQAKGIDYALDALLGSGDDARPYRGGTYAVVYLAPKNYHRVHAPWRGEVSSWRYIPGPLYPVNRLGIEHVPGVFARNERFVAHCMTEVGRAALIMVGATCVGHMKMSFTDLASNEGHAASGLVRMARPWAHERGDEFGVFEMGSTVVLCFERADVTPLGGLPHVVKVGEGVLSI